MFPAFRVFVFGLEVTKDVLSVSVTHSDGRGPSTAEIVLANKDADRGIEDRYVITERDIIAMTGSNGREIKLPFRTLYEQVLVALGQELNDVQLEINSLSSLSPRAGLPLRGQALQAAEVARRASLTLKEATIREKIGTLQTNYADVRNEIITDANALRAQVLEHLPKVVLDDKKRRVLTAKVGEVVDIGPPVILDATGKALYPYGNDLGLINTLTEVQAMGGLAPRYPFQVGESIFHSNDPVRIFYRDPRSSDWYYMFAGYISDTVDSIDTNNARVVSLRCEDVLRAFRYARFLTSPGIIDIQAVATQVDTVIRTFFSDDFTNFPLFEFLFTMVFGFQRARTIEIASRSGIETSAITGTVTKRLISASAYGRDGVDVAIQKDGVGLHSLEGSLVCFLKQPGSVAPVLNEDSTVVGRTVTLENLAQYQAIVDHQVRVTDLRSMLLESRARVLSAEIDTATPIEKVITTIGEHPELYPVDGGRLIILAPTELANKSPFKLDFKGVELKTGSFTSRLQKIYDVLERVEFSFYASPKGDLIAEMPLYDFDPVDFAGEVSHEDVKRVFRAVQRISLADTTVPSGQKVGPFHHSYVVAKQDTVSYSRSFSDENVRTLATCSYHPIKGLESSGDAVTTTGQLPARRLLGSLIPLFGVRHEEIPPNVLIFGNKAAGVYCQMMLNRFNGAAREISLEALPNLRIAPNRPIVVDVRSCVGTCREVTQQITWPTEMSMTLKLDHVRGWDGNRDEKTGRPFYSYLGGFRANTNNYALLFKTQEPPRLPAPEAPEGTEGTE
jgi:hypothetical protein